MTLIIVLLLLISLAYLFVLVYCLGPRYLYTFSGFQFPLFIASMHMAACLLGDFLQGKLGFKLGLQSGSCKEVRLPLRNFRKRSCVLGA